MSIKDKDAATLYAAMQDGTRPRPPSLRAMARAADEGWRTVAHEMRKTGWTAPNDDRAENAVHAIFRALCEANGMNVATLADVIRATP